MLHGGCTAFYVDGKDGAVLAQNWDWNVECVILHPLFFSHLPPFLLIPNQALTSIHRQAENLICLKIEKPDGLKIRMMTEAGIIGKIGINSYGVGCTLNAIKAHGLSYTKLPCHLALRTVMESKNTSEAVATLQKHGVASSCHILIGDKGGGVGVECSSQDIVLLRTNNGRVVHTNHYLEAHEEGVVEVMDWLPDTVFRVDRIRELLDGEKEVDVETAQRLLRDERRWEDRGAAICRGCGEDGLATLFSVVMDLKKIEARVVMGRPSEGGEKLVLKP